MSTILPEQAGVEHDLDQTRARLGSHLGELRSRMTPGAGRRRPDALLSAVRRAPSSGATCWTACVATRCPRRSPELA